MKPFSFHDIGGSITAPQGFQAAGVFCDIKRLGTGKGSNQGRKRDLALIVSDAPAAVAGTFTTNRICAAPVKLCVERVARGTARAIVANSGNANACTGRQGLRDAQAMARAVAVACHGGGNLSARSSGRFHRPHWGAVAHDPGQSGHRGSRAPAGKTRRRRARHAAEAIMTSDTRPKEIAVEFELGGRKVRLGGICKGAGMIQPGMSPTGARPALRLLARHHALFSDDRRGRRGKIPPGRAERGRGEKFQPHHGGRRHEHQRHGADPGQRARGKPCAGRASRRIAGFSRPRWIK